MSWDKSGSPTETALVLRRPPLFSTLRVYDTNALWRHDEIIRIRHLEAEIADMQKEIDRQKEKAVAANERLERLMKEMGITDPPKTGNDNQC